MPLHVKVVCLPVCHSPHLIVLHPLTSLLCCLFSSRSQRPKLFSVTFESLYNLTLANGPGLISGQFYLSTLCSSRPSLHLSPNTQYSFSFPCLYPAVQFAWVVFLSLNSWPVPHYPVRLCSYATSVHISSSVTWSNHRTCFMGLP